MKCKRCGRDMLPLLGCRNCAKQESADRAKINWRNLNTKQIVRVDNKINNKYKDAHREG